MNRRPEGQEARSDMAGKELSWLPQDQVDRMTTDLMEHADMTRSQLAEHVLEQAAPLAAYRIVQLVTHSLDERIGFQAAQYVLDRQLGKPKTTSQINLTQDNPVLQILEGVVVERGTVPADEDDDWPADDEDTSHGGVGVVSSSGGTVAVPGGTSQTALSTPFLPPATAYTDTEDDAGPAEPPEDDTDNHYQEPDS